MIKPPNLFNLKILLMTLFQNILQKLLHIIYCKKVILIKLTLILEEPKNINRLILMIKKKM